MVFLTDSTYKTNRYRFPLLDIVGVTPTEMTFSIAFAYLEEEHINNIVWALEWFRSIFMRRDTIPQVIVIDKDSTLTNAVKTVFPKSTNLLCQFHIDKNVKAKCKTLASKKKMHGIMSWKYEGVWWIVLLSKSSMNGL